MNPVFFKVFSIPSTPELKPFISIVINWLHPRQVTFGLRLSLPTFFLNIFSHFGQVTGNSLLSKSLLDILPSLLIIWLPRLETLSEAFRKPNSGCSCPDNTIEDSPDSNSVGTVVAELAVHIGSDFGKQVVPCAQLSVMSGQSTQRIPK